MDWDIQEAWASFMSGVTLKGIALEYGVAPQTVHKRFKKAGLVRRRNCKWSRDDLVRLAAAYEEAGDGPIDLAALEKALERPRGSLCAKAKELGYTDQSRPHTSEVLARASATHRLVNAMRLEPRRPALGMRHTDGTKRKMSEASRRAWRDPNRKLRKLTQAQRDAMSETTRRRMVESSNPYSRTKSGKRSDLGGTFFRSSWEANYARYLNLLARQGVIAGWEFEPDTFWFEKIRRGVRSYMPDFKVTNPDGSVYYVEVKGWMDAKSKTKIKRMAKYHPDVDLRVVGAKQYREIERKLGGAIPNWERAA